VDENGQAHAASHLRFVWSSAGYELVTHDGEPPAPGTEVTEGEKRFRVTKIAPSPLPGDDRPCAYLQPL
jgi:hypothetical protein